MLRRSAAVLVGVLFVCVFMVSPCASAEVSPHAVLLEQQLDVLGQKGFPAPVVAALWVRTSDMTPKDNPESLRDLAESFDLELFNLDGIDVIGPSQRRDFWSLASSQLRRIQSPEECTVQFLSSLDDLQWRMIASDKGLVLGSLREDQLSILKASFTLGNVVWPVLEDGSDDPTRVVPAEELPLRKGRVSARMGLSGISVQTRLSDGKYKSLGSYSVGIVAPRAGTWRLARDQRAWMPEYDHLWEYDLPARDEQRPPLVPNTLKPSDLDYSLSSLELPVSFEGKASLRDLIGLVVEKTGVTLRPSPGCDQVRLFVSVSGVSAGRLLKAVSVATTGTWRKVGGGEYLFTFDRAGIGQIDARVRESEEMARMQEANMARAWDDLVETMTPHKTLAFVPNSPFAFTLEQLDDLARRRALPTEEWGLPWAALTSDQQGLVNGLLADKMPADITSVSVSGGLEVELAFEFPGISRVYLSNGAVDAGLDVFPSRRHAGLSKTLADAPNDLRLPLITPIKACVWKPSRSDTPREIVDTLLRYGFNRLYLRVFADGYSLVPDSGLPVKEGLDADFLPRVISLAHENGIEVHGVIDVLRWSDGSKGHWLSKRRDLLDYDILARTQGQLPGIYGALPGYEGCLEQFSYGEALSGDGVTPFSDEVRSKLQGLVSALAALDLDGLVLDHASRMHGRVRTGMPGHNAKAREGFLHEYGADSIDVPPGSPIPSQDARFRLGDTPLDPIVSAHYELSGRWDEYYRRGCDDLVEVLAKEWLKVRAHEPVWVSGIPGRVNRQTHDWARFTGQLAGMLYPATHRPTECTGNGFSAIPVIRACDDIGTLLFASTLAKAQQQNLPNIPEEFALPVQPVKDAIIIDLTCAGRKKTSYLRLLGSAKP